MVTSPHISTCFCNTIQRKVQDHFKQFEIIHSKFFGVFLPVEFTQPMDIERERRLFHTMP